MVKKRRSAPEHLSLWTIGFLSAVVAVVPEPAESEMRTFTCWEMASGIVQVYENCPLTVIGTLLAIGVQVDPLSEEYS